MQGSTGIDMAGKKPKARLSRTVVGINSSWAAFAPVRNRGLSRFTAPVYRIRLQGRAELVKDGPLLGLFKEAELVVKVDVSETWINCPRYIHRYQKLERSRYAPGVEAETPFCEWKRIDIMQDVIRPAEQKAVEHMGTTTIDDWLGKVVAGDKGA